jgi:hypothetical protein
VCGNGVAEGDEECDGTDLAGNTCQDLGYSDPNGLACTGCDLDDSGCMPTCDGFLEPTEPCDDGNDNPFDGCDECVVVAPPLGSCAMPVDVTLNPGLTQVSGNTTMGGLQTTDQCDDEENARDVVFAVTPSKDGYVSAYMAPTDASYDSMLYAMDDCNDPSTGILCADNFPSGRETISFQVTAAQTYYVVVDGWQGAEGTFTLNLTLAEGTCADPVPFPLWQGIDMPASGATTGFTNEHTSTGCGGSISADVVYRVAPQFDGQVEARVLNGLTSYDAVIAARSSCADALTQIACDHDFGGGDETIQVDVTNGTPFFLWVDGWNSAEGSYRLDLSP